MPASGRKDISGCHPWVALTIFSYVNSRQVLIVGLVTMIGFMTNGKDQIVKLFL
jgi:hypothetical protein